jgi:hypothetical protein
MMGQMDLERLSITLKGFISEVEEIVTGLKWLCTRNAPTQMPGLQEQIARHFIKLTPSGSQAAKAALIQVPAFIVAGTAAVAPTLKKSNLANRSLGELRI